MKTMMKILASLLLGSMAISACKEKENEPAPPALSYDARDRFTGTYLVKDDSGRTYTMTISKFNANKIQYLKIDNLANMFDIPAENYNHGISNPYDGNYELELGLKSKLKDRQGKTWNADFGYELSGNGYKENFLYGNTMVLYFELSNLPYYDHEGVPFHMKFHKHIATKIN